MRSRIVAGQTITVLIEALKIAGEASIREAVRCRGEESPARVMDFLKRSEEFFKLARELQEPMPSTLNVSVLLQPQAG